MACVQAPAQLPLDDCLPVALQCFTSLLEKNVLMREYKPEVLFMVK